MENLSSMLQVLGHMSQLHLLLPFIDSLRTVLLITRLKLDTRF